MSATDRLTDASLAELESKIREQAATIETLRDALRPFAEVERESILNSFRFANKSRRAPVLDAAVALATVHWRAALKAYDSTAPKGVKP